MLAPGCYADGLALIGNPVLGDGIAEEESGGEEDSQGSSDSDSATTGDEAPETTGDEAPDDSAGDESGGHGGQQASCVPQQLDAPLPCDAAQSPSDTFAPVVAWTWSGVGEQNSILVTPLVANFDDDNADDYIDLCDQPDIAVVAVDLPIDKNTPLPPGTIYLLDSRTGEVERSFADPVDAEATPVLADLDNDGSPELLALQRGEDFGESPELRRVIAFEGDGQVAWVANWVTMDEVGSLSVADLDADGHPEILAPNHVLDADGNLLWQPLENPEGESIPVAVDLDLDGTLEVMFGRSAYDFDGNELFVVDVPGNKSAGIPAIANFDDDPYPEIYVQANQHRIFEHDGSLKGTCANSNKSLPVAIIDADLNGRPDVLLQRGIRLYAYEIEVEGDDYDGQGPDNRQISCNKLWDEKLSNNERSAGVSFDFLADGDAEAVHLDSESVKIFSAQGELLAQLARTARASTALPVIADADNDGAAELLIVGSEPEGGDTELEARPALTLIQNADDRFAPTRRIWNQHAYYTTNVREDGSIPSEQLPHWQQQNSFRNNPAPGYEGMLCQGGFD